MVHLGKQIRRRMDVKAWLVAHRLIIASAHTAFLPKTLAVWHSLKLHNLTADIAPTIVLHQE